VPARTDTVAKLLIIKARLLKWILFAIWHQRCEYSREPPRERYVEPSLVVIGVNFRTAPDAVRERFWISDAGKPEALRSLLRSEGVDEAIVLATGNRTEFIVWASDAALAANSILRFLTREYELKLCEWSNFYRLLDEEALLHVFRVMAGLDSNGDNEPEIESEVHAAWRAAQAADSTGRYLDAVIQKAATVAERVRSEVNEGQPVTDESHGAVACRTAVRVSEEVIAAEAQEFRKRLLAQQVVPTIVALRTRLDEICRQELNQLGEEFGPFTEDQQQALSKLASHITQRIAGGLARELKELPEKTEQEMLASAVQRLFHLEMRAVAERKN
jgi:glutamyl-tRNA reductase